MKENPSPKSGSRGARSTRAWQVRIDLNGIHPPVWRRVLVPERGTLLDLHGIIQDVFGWQDYHLHDFLIHGVRYGDPSTDEYGELGLLDEAKASLGRLGLVEGDRFTYTYDYGDDWLHTLKIEKVLPLERGSHLPFCIGGKRACPPEDVGGEPGYATFLEALADPRHEEHETYREWIGGAFDPEAFDLEAANERLRSRVRRARAGRWQEADEEDEAARLATFDPARWAALAADENEAAAREVPFRRDVAAFLDYIRDHKVTGTTSTGNLPLKAVAEVCARFVHPPSLEETVGSHVFRVRSEDEVWPLFMAHVLAHTAGLIDGGPGRRWRLTPFGEAYLDAPAAAQISVLFATWWYRIDWRIAIGFDPFGAPLPAAVLAIILDLLREIPGGASLQPRPFVDRVIEEVGWTWDRSEPDHMRDTLQAALERMIIHPLTDLGILAAELSRISDSRFEAPHLVSFSPTALGRALLGALAGTG